MKKLLNYIPVIIMLLIAAVVALLIYLGKLDPQEAITAVKSNKPLALLIILGLFALKGCAFTIPYGAVLIGCSLVFELPAATVISLVGTALCISVSYAIGRFSKELTVEKHLENHPKLLKYFKNANGNDFVFCFAVHTLHLSMEAQGVLFGLLRTSYPAYLLGSMIALFPSMMWFIVLGGAFDLHDPLLWFFLGLDALTVLIGLYYAKKHIINGKPEE